MRPVQYFTDEYLAQCKKMTPAEILQFLEDFRLLFAERAEKSEASQVEEQKQHYEPSK